jgi:hypothetical protein
MFVSYPRELHTQTGMSAGMVFMYKHTPVWPRTYTVQMLLYNQAHTFGHTLLGHCALAHMSGPFVHPVF